MSSTSHGSSKHAVEQTYQVSFVAYKLDLGEYPTTEEGLQALLVAPKGKEEKWNGPYIEKLPFDPWGNEYQYRYPSMKDNVEFEFFSLGRDGVESRDDIANWKDNKEPVSPFVFLIVAIVVIVAISVIWRIFRTLK